MMNIFHVVARKSMRENRTRTIVTIIGVILSAAMFTAVTTFAVSLLDFMERTYIYNSGDWHISAEDTSAQIYAEIQEDERLEGVFAAVSLGYAPIDSENTYKPYLYVLAGETDFFEKMPVHLTQGRFPENSSEILIPDHVARNGGVEYTIGQTITLTLGERMLDGERLNQYNPFDEDLQETLEVRETREYTVVGFYERPDFENYSAPGYTALTFWELSEPNDLVQVYFRIKNVVRDLDAVDDEYNDICTIQRNWDVLAFSGGFLYGNYQIMLYSLASVFVFLIVLGSVSLIYSVFSISVGERTRQYGLLVSIGATRRQLRSSVLHEAMIVAGIGIPIGILCGIAGMAVTFYFTGGLFSSVITSPFSVHVTVSPISVLTAALLTLTTVLISVWVPSRRAMSVTAIEAIRQSGDIRDRGKPIKTGKLVYRLFGLPGMLAKKYYKRSRKKYRTTIISLAMSVTLFISAASFCMYLRMSVDTSLSTSNYDWAYALSDRDFDTLLDEIRQTAGVKSANWLTNTIEYLVLPREDYSDSYDVFAAAQAEAYGSASVDTEGRTSVLEAARVFYIDDESFDAMLIENGIDPKTYREGDAVLLDNYTYTLYINRDDGTAERKSYSFSIVDAGIDTLTLLDEGEGIEGYNYYGAYYADDEPDCDRFVYRYIPVSGDAEYDDNGEMTNAMTVPAQTHEIRIGARITTPPAGVDIDTSYPALLYPYSVCNQDIGYGTIHIVSDDHETMVENVKALLLAYGYSLDEDYYYDVHAQEQDSLNIITIINVFSYGFIVLISMISAANVFNTISTNITLRRRDFAMLRSVGMEQRALYRMTNYECLLYGSRALLLGMPGAYALSRLIYAIVHEGIYMQFTLPWGFVAIAVISVFIVVFVSMLYAMRRIRDDNPIDTLKNENI